MPTYEYECPQGHSFEVFQKMTDQPVAKCPECGKKARRKISGGAGFLFKGEGFYITDYRSEDYKKKASSESGESSKSDKSEKSEKSEKPAAKEKAASASAKDEGKSGSKASKRKSDE